MFSKLDARPGYWNVKLDADSKLLTTPNTPHGRYCFKRLPFGLLPAQDVFQKIDQTYEGLPDVIGITDDIIVYGENDADHDSNPLIMLEHTRQVGLGLNPDKYDIRKDSNQILWQTRLMPDPDKISIANIDTPKPVSELQFVLGIANYLIRFTPKLAA